MSEKNRTAMTIIWDFFCSVKLTIVTLILLATTATIGTVIQQNLDPHQYMRIYSQSTYRIFSFLDFFDMYHSWWFLGLLGLLALNLVACSIKRFPRVWKSVKNPNLTPDDGFYRTFSNAEEIEVGHSPSEVRNKLESFLRKRFAKPVVTEKGGKVHLFAQKAPYTRFSVYVTHLSILIILLGALTSAIWGFKGYVNIPERAQTSQVWPLKGGEQARDLGFTLHLDSFHVVFYPGTSAPKQYESIVTIIDHGKVAPGYDHVPLVVNHPLTYKGYTFYQANYGSAGASSLDLQIKNQITGQTRQVTLKENELLPLLNGSYLQMVGFTTSYQNYGPAAKLEMLPQTGRPFDFVVMENFPNYDAKRKGIYLVSMNDYVQKSYAGFQVAKDKGVWIVWLGCALLLLGSLCAFFLSHRRIWITLQEVDDKTRIKLGGAAHRNRPAFNLFFDNFKENLRSEISGSKTLTGTGEGDLADSIAPEGAPDAQGA